MAIIASAGINSASGAIFCFYLRVVEIENCIELANLRFGERFANGKRRAISAAVVATTVGLLQL